MQKRSKRWILKRYPTGKRKGQRHKSRDKRQRLQRWFQQRRKVKRLPMKSVTFFCAQCKGYEEYLEQALGIIYFYSIPEAHGFISVQNKNQYFSKIINEEALKVLEFHIIATSLILPPPHMMILEYIFYFFDPKGHFCKSKHQKKGETSGFFFLLQQLIQTSSTLPFFSSHNKTEQYTLNLLL